MTDYEIWDDLTLDTTPAATDRIVKMSGSTAAFDSVSLEYLEEAWKGTSLPGSPRTNQYFYRTDFRSWFFYTGSAWVQTTFGSGGAFPSSPTTNLKYYRTDLGLLAYYDGTNWLSMHIFNSSVNLYNVAYTNQIEMRFSQPRTDYAPAVVRCNGIVRVRTTNDGSNYWTFNFRSGNAALTTTSTVYSFNTSAIGAGAYTDFSAAPSTAKPTNYSAFDFTASTTGSPGNYDVMFSVDYRLKFA